MRHMLFVIVAVCSALAVAPLATADPTPLATPPSNDAFAAAAPVPMPATVSGTVDGATVEPGERGPGQTTVWYRFRAARSERLAVELTDLQSMCGEVDVYTGDSIATLTVAGAHAGTPRRVVLDGTAGQDYKVQVGDECSGDTGTAFTLRVAAAPRPANDDFAAAQSVKVPRDVSVSLRDASAELGEPREGGSPASHSVWFRFKLPHAAPMTIDASASSCGAFVGAYTGGTLSGLHKVAERSSVLRFKAAAKQTYRVRIDCSDYNTDPGPGTFAVTFSDGSIQGKGISLAVAPGQTVAGARARGLKVSVSAKRTVTLNIELRVSRSTTRRLGLASSSLGHVTGRIEAGQTLPAAIPLSSAARKALAGRQALSGTIRLSLLTNAPNRVLNVPVRLPS